MISQSLRFPYRVPILLTTQSLWCPFVVPVQVSICFPNAHDVTIRELFIQRYDPFVISKSVECPYDFPTLYDDQILKVPINVLI